VSASDCITDNICCTNACSDFENVVHVAHHRFSLHTAILDDQNHAVRQIHPTCHTHSVSQCSGTMAL
jgi:hypothetical protein